MSTIRDFYTRRLNDCTCGGEPEILVHTGYKRKSVRCPECGDETEPMSCAISGETYQRVIRRWNKTHPDNSYSFPHRSS